jgi:hypothetical protein
MLPTQWETNAMPNTDKPELESRKDAPLHRPSGPIDAGSSDSHDKPIVEPSGQMNTVKPTPGSEAPGQVSKM